MSGANRVNAQGVYGTKGVPTAGQYARFASGIRFLDRQCWGLVGCSEAGEGREHETFSNHYNDLWRYGPGSGP